MNLPSSRAQTLGIESRDTCAPAEDGTELPQLEIAAADVTDRGKYCAKTEERRTNHLGFRTQTTDVSRKVAWKCRDCLTTWITQQSPRQTIIIYAFALCTPLQQNKYFKYGNKYDVI